MSQRSVTLVLDNKLQNKFKILDNNEFWVNFHIYDNDEAAIWWRKKYFQYVVPGQVQIDVKH